MLSRSDEIGLGQQVKRNVERQNRLVNDPEINARMQRIADRIFPLARKDFDVPYEIKIIDKKEVNAFALPGGPIYFYKGLIDLAESDDEIAAVLGHEATHVSKRHSGRQISDAQGKSTIAQLLLGRAGNVANLLANIAFSLDQLKYSRDDETQSDEIGFRYLTQAGYDPRAMASFFRKMEKKARSGGPEWLNSHPVTRKRIEAAEKRASDYIAANGGGSAVPAAAEPATVPAATGGGAAAR
jgi:predicted Zn-dependent protease